MSHQSFVDDERYAYVWRFAPHSSHFVNRFLNPIFLNKKVFQLSSSTKTTAFEEMKQSEVYQKVLSQTFEQFNGDLYRTGLEMLSYCPTSELDTLGANDLVEEFSLLPSLSFENEEESSDEESESECKVEKGVTLRNFSIENGENTERLKNELSRLPPVNQELSLDNFLTSLKQLWFSREFDPQSEDKAVQLITSFFHHCESLFREMLDLNLLGTKEAIEKVCNVLYFLKLLLIQSGKIQLLLSNSDKKDKIHYRQYGIIPEFYSFDLNYIQHLFFEYNVLNPLVILLYSFCDEIKYLSGTVLLLLQVETFSGSLVGVSMSDIDVHYKWKESILQCYMELVDANNWLDLLGDHTFKTQSLALTKEEARHIIRRYEQWFFQNMDNDISSGGDRVIETMLQKLNDIIVKDFHASPVFIKLSSRSPKDAVFQCQEYKEMYDKLSEDWANKYGADFVSQNSTIESAIEQICAAKCMVCTSAKDFLFLMQRSARVHRDLTEALVQCEHSDDGKFSVAIVVRQWESRMLSHFEVRAFIRNRQLNAASQYFSNSYFPFVTIDEWIALKDRI